MTEDIPAHGTLRRAMGNRRNKWRRCPCPPCRTAERRYTKRRKYLADRGTPLLVDATPTIDHVQRLRAAGDAFTLIAARHNIPRKTLQSLLAGIPQRVHRTTEQAILAITPGTCLDPYASVPATGTIRRIQALMAAGHSLNAIKAAASIQHATASLLVNAAATTIRRNVADRVDRAYIQLAPTRGTSVRSLNRATREGWHDPLWWDDWDRIDDPAFDPATAERELSRDELGALRRHEIQHLMAACCTADQIAERLDMAVTTVRAIMAELATGTRRDRSGAAA